MAIFCFEMDVTSHCNELFRDGLLPFLGCAVEWSEAILLLKIDVTASCKEQLRDGRNPT